MNELVKIGQHEITAKVYKGERVVTFKDIDLVHERPEGTARKRFNDNKDRLVEGRDYFKITPSEFRTAIGEMDLRQQNDVTLITERGYLMLVKSFTDDLAWEVQGQLVDNYFNVKQALIDYSNLTPELQMFKQIFDSVVAQQQMCSKALETSQQALDRVEGIRDIVGLNPNAWREECTKVIYKIALSIGGKEFIKENLRVVNTSIYESLNGRFGVDLKARLRNKQARMVMEGISKSKAEKVNYLDIIAEDKKLIEGYIMLVKELAIKNNVSWEEKQ